MYNVTYCTVRMLLYTTATMKQLAWLNHPIPCQLWFPSYVCNHKQN